MTEPARTQYTYQELNAFDHLDVDGLCSLFSLEMSGEAFYNAMADRVGNDKAAELLRRNGREEGGHARRLQRAIAIKLGTENGWRSGTKPNHDRVRALCARADIISPWTVGRYGGLEQAELFIRHVQIPDLAWCAER